MKINAFLRVAAILTIISVNIGCDQISKNLVRTNIATGEWIPVVDEHVVLTKVENTGAMLSMGDDLPPLAKKVLLLGLPALILLVSMGWLFTRNNLDKPSIFFLSSVIGDGMGNIFDRFCYGSVTDFCYIHVGIFQTGIFNGADLSITFGVLAFALYQLWKGQFTNPPIDKLTN